MNAGLDVEFLKACLSYSCTVSVVIAFRGTVMTNDIRDASCQLHWLEDSPSRGSRETALISIRVNQAVWVIE